MWFTWVILIGMAVAMYLIIYKYEKKMDALHDLIKENKSSIEENHTKIKKNQSKLKEHNSYIERMWVTIPKDKEES
jgi:predicted Holliday junction resolvase-like endonuclease